MEETPKPTTIQSIATIEQEQCDLNQEGKHAETCSRNHNQWWKVGLGQSLTHPVAPWERRTMTRQRCSGLAWSHHWDEPTHPFLRPDPSYNLREYAPVFWETTKRLREKVLKGKTPQMERIWLCSNGYQTFSFSIHPKVQCFQKERTIDMSMSVNSGLCESQHQPSGIILSNLK